MSKKFAPITYQLRSGSYSIDNLRFRPGDKLIYSSGIAVAIENNAPKDGFIDVVSVFNGIESRVRLRVPRDKDGPVSDIASFNEVFGPGSLTFDPAITQAQAKGKTVSLEGNAGPGIDNVAIFAEGAETPLGFASVTNGIWFFTIPELEVGTHTFFARGVFPGGELGDDSLVKEVTVLEPIPLTFTPNHSEIFELPGTLNTVTYTITGRAGTTVQLALAPDSEASEDDISITGLSNDNQLTLGVNGTATFSVTALQDDETEIGELLRFLVSDVDDPNNTATADVTIRDFLPLTLTPNLTEIFEQPEAPNTVLYTITGLPGTRVQLAIAEDSIADAGDILSTNLPDNNQLLLNAQGLATFSVTARQDDLPELSELLRVSVFDLDNPANSASADVTIFDVTPLSISADRSTIFEQPGLPDTVVYTITGTPGLTVRLAIAPDSIADADDILSTLPDDNLLTLNDDGIATFSVTARQDDTPEFDELLRVNVSDVDDPTNTAFADVTIRDLTQLTVTSNRSRIYEQPGLPDTVIYTIAGSPGATVRLAIAPDSVADADDILSPHLPNNDLLTLNDDGIATFSVTARQDDITELDELLRISVTDIDNPINTAIADVTISDTTALSITPNRTEIYEQPGLPDTVTYTISGAPGATVQWAIAEDSVADADDILSTNDNRLVLNAQGIATFSVTARQDDIPELAELLRVSVFDLDHPSNSASADVTIVDVTPLSISADRSSIFERPGLPDTVVYTITGTPGLTVRLAIAPGSVADAADILSTHLPDNNLLTLNDDGIATFSVTARQDDTPEFDELLRVSVTEIDNPTSVVFADVTIRDLTQLTITPDQLRIYEQPGAPNTVTYTITGSPGAAVQLAIAPDSVADTDDILTTNLPDNNLLTLNDDGIATFSVTARQDDITELDELLRISVTDILNQNNTAIADVTISDTTPLSITPNRTEIYEQPGTPNTVTYTISGAPGATVQWAIAEDSVADADDILSTNDNQLVLNAQGLATFSVTARQDDIPELSELLRVSVFDIDHPANSASTDVTIVDVTPLSISTDRSKIFEQPGLPDTVTYTISGAPGATVQWAIAEDSVADADDILSTHLPGDNRLVLNAQGLAAFSVTARQDDLTEPGELLRVVVFDLDHSENSASVDITISDFKPLTLTPDRSSIYEQPGAPNTVIYTIAGTPGATVRLAIAEGSTADADDILSTHLPDNNLLTLNDDGIATFSVTARQDYIAENDELLRVSVTDIDNPNDTATAEVTISDITPLSITRNRTQIYEQPGTPNTVTYRITGTPGAEVQLEIPSNSVAKAGDISSAHLPNNNRLTLDANGVATFSVTAVQDDLVEGNELFRVLVRDVEHRNNTASVSITIRDYMELTITPDRTEIHELPGSPNTVTYTVTGLPGSDISISRYGEASSADGQDFELSAVTVGALIDDSEAPDEFVIRLNANGEARFVITAVQDFISEDPETLVLRASELNNPDNVALSATLVIQDTDPFRLTVDIDNLTGTDNNNEFDGSLFFSDLNDGLATLNTGDIVDGGLGFDTLEADLLAGAVAPTLISIEDIILWGVEAGAIFDISNSTGIVSISTDDSYFVTVTAGDSTAFNDITLSGAMNLDLTGDYSPLSDAHLQIWGDLWVNSSSKQVIDLSNQNDDLYIEFRYSSADELTLPISVESEDFYGAVLSYTNATFSAPISITNFTAGRDQIIFDRIQASSFFSALPDGDLTDHFVADNFGSEIPELADPTDIYLIYNTFNGKLYYDADEGGDGLPVEILQLIGAPTLSADDLELWWGL